MDPHCLIYFEILVFKKIYEGNDTMVTYETKSNNSYNYLFTFFVYVSNEFNDDYDISCSK